MKSPTIFLGTHDPGDEARANQAADALTVTCQGLVAQVGIKGILDGLLSVYLTLSMQTVGEDGTRAALRDTSANLPRLTAMMRAQGQDPKGRA